MSSNSRWSSLTACPVSHSPAHTPILQPPPSPFLLFNGPQPPHCPQTVTATDTETISRSLSPPQPGFATDTSNVSHLDVPKTPFTIAKQPSCPSAPRRQPSCRLYRGHSIGGSGGNTNSSQLSTGNNMDQGRLLLSATHDTAASLRQLVANAEAVSSPQDMLCRLHPDTCKVTPTAATVSEGCMPVPVMPMPGCSGTDASPSALRAKRLKLFGQARSNFPTTDCIQSSPTAVLLPAQSQQGPLTVRTDPFTVQNGPPTALPDCTVYARQQTRGLLGRAVASGTQSVSGVQLIACACVVVCTLLCGVCCTLLHQSLLKALLGACLPFAATVLVHCGPQG